MFTQLTDELNAIESLPDTPNRTSGYTAQQIKQFFDENAQTIKEFINNVLIKELEDNGAVSGFSGAKNIGVANKSDFGGFTNVEDVLTYFRELIRSAVAGEIGDDDIKTNMLDHSVGEEAVDTGAIKNNAVTNSKLAGGITKEKISSVYASAIDGKLPVENLENIPYTALAGGIRATQLYGDIPLSKLVNGYIVPVENGGTGKTTQETIAMDVTFKDGTTATYNLVVS